MSRRQAQPAQTTSQAAPTSQPLAAAKPAKSRPQDKPKRYHVSASQSGQLTFNLMLLLKAAVPTGEALESLQDTTDSRPLKKAIRQMCQDVDNGLPLWQAMERSGAVGTQTVALVRIGEQSGNLVANLQVAAVQEEKQRMFHAKVRAALAYPIIVLAVTLTVGLAVSWFLLPKLAVTFEQLQVKLPLISRIFIDFGTFLKSNGYWAVPGGLGGLALLLYLLFGFPWTRSLGQRLLLHIPGVGGLVRDVEVARFGYLLGLLLEAGLSVMQALQMLGVATSSPRYKSLYTWLGGQFENGYSFSTSLRSKKSIKRLLPVTVQQMVIAGERTGTLPETLQSVGKMYEERSDIATSNLESTMEPVLLVFVSLGVLAVAIAVILPIYGLIGGLNQ